MAAAALEMIALLVCASFVGCSLRIGLDSVLASATDGATATYVPASLLANVLGCAAMGFLAHLSRIPDSKRSHPVFVAATTGLCGSLTTFSGLMGQAVSAAFKRLFTEALLVLLVGVTTSLAALFVGSHFAALISAVRPHAKQSTSPCPTEDSAVVDFEIVVVIPEQQEPQAAAAAAEKQHPTRCTLSWRSVALAATVLLVVGGLIVMAVLWQAARKVAVAVLVAPLGTFARWLLGKNNARCKHGPYFTTIANVLGSVILGALGAPVISEHWAAWAVATGFAGSLSTMSTFALDIEKLPLDRSYIYGSASIIASLGFLAVVRATMLYA